MNYSATYLIWNLGLTEGVTDPNRMFTPLMHMILSLSYSKVYVCQFSDLYFLQDLVY
jgi:hypothetical protein